MGGFPILSVMLLVPLAAAVACLFLEAKAARNLALIATLVEEDSLAYAAENNIPATRCE